MFAMIVDKIITDEVTKAASFAASKSVIFPKTQNEDKTERLFLANSFDFIELLVQFNMIHLYP